jgi:hypothetical protein
LHEAKKHENTCLFHPERLLQILNSAKQIAIITNKATTRPWRASLSFFRYSIKKQDMDLFEGNQWSCTNNSHVYCKRNRHNFTVIMHKDTGGCSMEIAA